MELRDIRYFVVVAEHLNLARSAEALGLSATALSKCLRRLEQQLGTKLVQRTSKGVSLTAVGTALRARIGPLQGILNDVQQEAGDLASGRAGHVHVGIGTGAPEDLIASASVALLAESSKITLKVFAENPDILSNAMRKGEIDFCLSIAQLFPSAEFAYEPLYDDQLVIFASAHHRLAKRKHISLAEITGERWVLITNSPWHASLQRVFEANKLPQPSLALDTNSEEVRIFAIAYSNYLGISSRQFVRQEARKFPLIELPISEMSNVTDSRQLAVIYRKGAYLSPAARRLIEKLKSQVKTMDAPEPATKTHKNH